MDIKKRPHQIAFERMGPAEDEQRTPVKKNKSKKPHSLMELPSEILERGILTKILTDKESFNAFSRVSKAAGALAHDLAKAVTNGNGSHLLNLPNRRAGDLAQPYSPKPHSVTQEQAAHEYLRQEAYKALHASQAALLDQKKIEAACTFMAQAVTDYPDFAALKVDFANVLSLSGQLEQAKEQSKDALELGLNPVGDLARQARAHIAVWRALNGRKLDAARRFYKLAIAEWKAHPRAHLGLGDCLRKQGHLAEAKISYRYALTLLDTLADAHYGLGLCLSIESNHEDAELNFRAALVQRPNYPEAHLGMGLALIRQGKHSEAESSLRSAIAQRSNGPDAHWCLGGFAYAG